jgi:hypothetical protein
MAAAKPIHFKNRRTQRIVLTAIIISPLAVLTLLCVWMYYAIRAEPYMNAPARGAGAGQTGMANEYMGGKKPSPAAPAAPATPGPAAR